MHNPACWTLSVFALTIVLMFQAEADAAVYKWMDDQGVTHYANTPPLHGDFTTVKTQADPAAAEVDTATPVPATPSPAAEPPQRMTLQATQQAADPELCRKVAAEIDRLADIARIRLQTGDTTKLLSEEEKQAFIQERRDWYETNCK